MAQEASGFVWRDFTEAGPENCRHHLFITGLVEDSDPGVDSVYSNGDWLANHLRPSVKNFPQVNSQ